MGIDEGAAREQEAGLAQTYLDTAILGREVAALALQQALRDAQAGNLRDPAKTAVSAITASAIALDKRLVLQERPTQYIASVDPRADALALFKTLGITIDATATEIPAEQIPASTPPRQSSPTSPARGRARKTRERE